jgi:fructose/tagatose bisphosphate aldolase
MSICQRHASKDHPRRNAAAKSFASIDLDGGIGCVVRNLSDTKATIEVAQPQGLPVEFEIAIEGESAKRYCAIAWRNDRQVGVFFV